MDCSDIVDFNRQLLNRHDLQHSFFQLVRDDPTQGFEFDATSVSGHMYNPAGLDSSDQSDDELRIRLVLGSHLAQHMRHKLEEDKGYTSTVGISTSKLLAKLVGSLNKPKGQTTLMPPYSGTTSNVTTFIDAHDIGKIPNIGFKMSHKIRDHVLGRTAAYDTGLIYGGTKESVTVGDVRCTNNMSPELLEKLLGGAGAERGIGAKAWQLIKGIDDSEVKEIRKMPSQISIEDSYIRLDTMSQIMKEFRILGTSLLKRMRTDLLESDEVDSTGIEQARWIALPKTLRLSTRPRPPLNADGTRSRTFQRISRSGPLPNFVFSLSESIDTLVEKLIQTALLPMFRRLHPESHGWNLSLMNIGVTNMVETASNDRSGGGRDIGNMFKRQEEVLKEWKIEDRDVPPDVLEIHQCGEDLQAREPVSETPVVCPQPSAGSGAELQNSAGETFTSDLVEDEGEWIEDDDETGSLCQTCGTSIPDFAMAAHERFHSHTTSV